MNPSSSNQRWRLSRLCVSVTAVVTVGIFVVLLSGCTVSSPARVTSTPVAVSTPATSLRPDGTAQENLPFFSAVIENVAQETGSVTASAYVDALAGAGFARADMQMTADTTTVGNPAESVQFSVRWGEADCLVGQVGPSTGVPVVLVMPQLPGGRCLIGETPDVDKDQ